MHGPVAGARTVGGNTTTTHLHSITRRPIRSSSAAAAAAKTEEWDNVASRDCMYALLLFILPTYVSRHSCGTPTHPPAVYRVSTGQNQSERIAQRRDLSLTTTTTTTFRRRARIAKRSVFRPRFVRRSCCRSSS